MKLRFGQVWQHIGRLLVLSVGVAMLACQSGVMEMPRSDEPAGSDLVSPPDAGSSDDSDIRDAIPQAQSSTWLVLALNPTEVGSATAFAVAPNLLATNAHVVDLILDIMVDPDGLAGVVQHETGRTLAIKQVWMHPDWDPDLPLGWTPDIGLLAVDDRLEALLPIADQAALESVSVFDDVALCGFPGEVLGSIDLAGVLTGGPFFPRTSCLDGTISALRPMNPSDTLTPQNAELIQYNMSTSHGTSGSAVVNSEGQVIGVHALGLSQDGGEYNVAFRGDTLRYLLALVAANVLNGIALDDWQLPDAPFSPPPLDDSEQPPAPPAPPSDPPGEEDPPFQPTTCISTYYNREWNFGFDLPSGFEGPVVPPSTAGQHQEEFSLGDYTTIDVMVWNPFPFGLEAEVASWISIVDDAGTYELISIEDVSTPTGQEGIQLYWVFPSSSGDSRFDIHILEQWTEGRWGTVRLTITAFPDEFFPLRGLWEETAGSLCTD